MKIKYMTAPSCATYTRRLFDEWIFIQSCLDCGIIPSKSKIKNATRTVSRKTKPKYLDITEIELDV